MALTGEQIVAVAEITRESYSTIAGLTPSLTPDQENSLSDDLDIWASIRDSHVKLSGGSNGVEFDNTPKRAAIFYRIRNMLELPYLSFSFDLDLGGGYSSNVGHTMRW